MKKRIALLLLAFLMLAGTQLFAQIRFGVKGGLNFANIIDEGNDEVYNNDNKFNVGFHLGVTAEYGFTKSFFIEPGLLFATKGYKTYSSIVDNSGVTLMKVDVRYNINYLELPINFIYKLDLGSVKVFANAGPYLGYAISGKIKADEKILGDNWNKDEEDIKIGYDKDKDVFKPLDLGMNVGTGVEISNVTVGVQYGLGLTNISTKTEDGLSAKNRVLGVSVGYKFGGK